ESGARGSPGWRRRPSHGCSAGRAGRQPDRIMSQLCSAWWRRDLVALAHACHDLSRPRPEPAFRDGAAGPCHQGTVEEEVVLSHEPGPKHLLGAEQVTQVSPAERGTYAAGAVCVQGRVVFAVPGLAQVHATAAGERLAVARVAAR